LKLSAKFGFRQFITVNPNLNAIVKPPLSLPNQTMTVSLPSLVMQDEETKTLLTKQFHHVAFDNIRYQLDPKHMSFLWCFVDNKLVALNYVV